MAKINDPVRAEAYAHLGIATLCRTNLMTTAVLGHLGQARAARARASTRPSASTRRPRRWPALPTGSAASPATTEA